MNWKHTLLLWLALLASGSFALAQEPAEEEDVIYLKNGSVIRGDITERIIEKGVRIEILGGSVLAFPEAEIETILRAPKVYQPAPPANYFRDARSSWRRERPVKNRQRGFYNMVSFGFQPTEDVWGDVVPWPTLQYRTGYHFSQYINLGMGTGIDAYGPGGTVPFYLDFHGEVGKEKRMMPHYYLHAGYGIGAWTNWAFEDFQGGPMGHIGVGWKLNTRSSAEWLFTAGYKMQSTSYIVDGEPIWGQPISLERIAETFHSLVLQVAFGF